MSSANLLLFLVNDLLDLFKLKNGKFQKNEENCDFKKELQELIDIF